MSDEPDSLILRYLRRLAEQVDGLRDDMREVKERLGLLEGGQASISRRVDRIESRLERIGRRLDLEDAPT